MTDTKLTNKLYFTNIQMRNALIQIEDRMVHSMWMPDVIMGVNRGGVIPGVYLSHRIKKSHEVLDVRLRDHQAEPDMDNLYRAISQGKKILVIDDINDTGATLQHIADNCIYDSRIRYAAVINNRPSPFELNYFGYEIDKSVNDQWVVFPWEDWDK
jgi:uncharacterized protein